MNTLKKTLILLASISLLSACGEPPIDDEYIRGATVVHDYNDYYASLRYWENGKDLKEKLYKIISKNYVPSTYASNWSTNQNGDQDLYLLDDVNPLYSSDPMDKTNTASNTNPNGWEREHAFVAGLMTGKGTGEAVKTKGIATDFHNLFAATSSGNRSRGEKNYGKVTKQSGSNGDAIFDEKTFEPNDFDKGRVSRAIFYIATMFGNDSWVADTYGKGTFVREEPCTVSGSDRCHGNLSALLEWNSSFKTDRLEYQHNEYVLTKQKNRNPYVDFPELVDWVYGSKANQRGRLCELTSSVNALEINETKFSNTGVSSYKRSYFVGDKFDKNADLNVYSISNNFTKTKVSDFTSSITDGFEFTTTGDFSNTIGYNDSSVTYQFSVSESTYQNCNYQYVFDKTCFGDKAVAGQFFDSTFNNVDYEVNLGDLKEMSFKKPTGNDGINIGNASKNDVCGTLTLRSKEAFTFEDKTSISKVYIVISGAAKKTYVCNISIGDTIIFTGSTNNNELVEVGGTLDTPMSGQISIVISDITAAINLHGLYVQVD